MRAVAAALAVMGSLTMAASAAAFDPATEAQNFSKTLERQAIYTSPEGQLLLRQVGTRNELASLQAQLADPERAFSANLCARGEDGCAGDPRLYDWEAKGYGIVRAGPVDRPQRRDDLRPRVGDRGRPGARARAW